MKTPLPAFLSPCSETAKVIEAAWDTAIFRSEDAHGALFFFDPPERGDADFAAKLGIRLGRTAGARLINSPTDLE